MQTSSVSPATNTTNTTKSREQILIQSSGAMIAVIVVGIIIILTVLLVILKTYNRRTHVSRVLGSSKPRVKTSQSTGRSALPLTPVGVGSASGIGSVSGSVSQNGFGPDPSSGPRSQSSFRLPRVEPSDESVERSSVASTVVTIHDLPPMENT